MRMKWWPRLECPFCQGVLRNTDVYPARPVVCPTCGAKLQPSIREGRLSGLIGLCLTLAICYLLGLSGVWFVVATILLWFPIFVIWGFFFVRLRRPRFETYDPQIGFGPKFISLGLSKPSSSPSPDLRDSGAERPTVPRPGDASGDRELP